VSLLDILVLILVGTSMVAGFVAGFARVGIGFIASVCGLLFGFWFYGFPAALIHKFIHSTTVSNLIGFFLVFWAFVVAGALIGKLLAKLFKWTGLSWLDRLLGGVFGFARGAFISVIFITAVMAFTPKPMPNWMVQSKVLPYAIDASNILSSLAPSTIKDAFRESMQEIRKAWDDEVRRAKDKLAGKKPELQTDPESDQSGKQPSPKKPSSKKKENSRVGQSVDF
jgi:membrane protein required for colicin V production